MSEESVINQFTSLKGVGKAKAKFLYDNGFTSLEKLKGASLENLTKIEGINDALAKGIIDQTNSAGKTEKAEKPKQEKKSETKTEEKAVQKIETKEKPVKEEEVQIVEEKEKEYKVKKKPELDSQLKGSLQKRKEVKKRTPKFLREEWFRYKRIPRNWRRPDGITSKMRINLKYRPSKVRVGFRGPKDARGLHPSGFEEVIVHNANDIQNLDPKTQAARIGGSVGTRKRIEIGKKAEELDIRILNM